MSQGKYDSRSFKIRNRPYMYAIVAAIIVFILVAPEVNEGKAMDPTIKDGSFVVMTKERYSQKRGAPDLGQVVILEKTAAKELSEDNIIARVTGLPGDRIKIQAGTFYRNGKEYNVKNAKGSLGGNVDLKLKENEVFLLCDNRDTVMDSRAKELGPVDMEMIRGNAKWILWPLSHMGGIK